MKRGQGNEHNHHCSMSNDGYDISCTHCHIAVRHTVLALGKKGYCVFHTLSEMVIFQFNTKMVINLWNINKFQQHFHCKQFMLVINELIWQLVCVNCLFKLQYAPKIGKSPYHKASCKKHRQAFQCHNFKFKSFRM